MDEWIRRVWVGGWLVEMDERLINSVILLLHLSNWTLYGCRWGFNSIYV